MRAATDPIVAVVDDLIDQDRPSRAIEEYEAAYDGLKQLRANFTALARAEHAQASG